jgi:hypothetical protein
VDGAVVDGAVVDGAVVDGAVVDGVNVRVKSKLNAYPSPEPPLPSFCERLKVK